MYQAQTLYVLEPARSTYLRPDISAQIVIDWRENTYETDFSRREMAVHQHTSLPPTRCSPARSCWAIPPVPRWRNERRGIARCCRRRPTSSSATPGPRRPRRRSRSG
jgi:hypothetical protein